MIDIKKFISENKELISKMQNCYHGLKDDPFGNPFHMEGDIWTHTMMVLQEGRKFSNLKKAVLLLHDLGKIDTRQEVNDRVRFKGHEFLSVLLSLKYLKNFTDQEKINISKLILYHTSILKKLGQENCLPLLSQEFKHDPELLLDLIDITKADAYGRIMNDSYAKELSYLDDYLMGNILSLSNVKQEINQQANIVTLIGLPGVGKSTYLKNNKINTKNIISRDETIERIFKDSVSNVIGNLTDRDKKKIQLDMENKKKILVDQNEDIYFDMLNLSLRDRLKNFKNIPRNKHYKCVFFLDEYENILKRNNDRKNKKVSEEYIKRQISLFEPPTYSEFDEIEWRLIND